jgi:hypothetical protein
VKFIYYIVIMGGIDNERLPEYIVRNGFFGSLQSGNILAKDTEYLAGATLAGIVIGARVPLMLTCRSDPSAARLISAAIAVLLHQHWDSDGVSAIATSITGDES